MRKAMEELMLLLKAKTECIWVTTTQEAEFIEEFTTMFRSISNFNTFNIRQWSNTSGLKTFSSNLFEENSVDLGVLEPPVLFMKCIKEEIENKKNNAWLLLDLPDLFTNPKTARFIRDFKETPQKDSYNPFIVITPNQEIPTSLAHLFKQIEFGLPEVDQLFKVVDDLNAVLKIKSETNPNIAALNHEEVQEIATACTGMTLRETEMALKESVVRFKRVDLPFILNTKIETVKKTGVLDYKVPSLTLDDIGGHELLKQWLKDQKACFSPKAREYGIDTPKGYVALGVSGCGKTAIAEAFAGYMQIPLLSLSMNKIMNRMVGESERKIVQALEIARRSAPCVLLIDEVEKMLGGKKDFYAVSR